MTITKEQEQAIIDLYEEETGGLHLGERDAIGADRGITGVLDILGIKIEGINA